MSVTAAFPSRARAWLRGLLAGPLALLTALLTMMGGALWLPEGAAGLDHLVVPVVFFPMLWAGWFLYACLDPRLLRGFAVVGGAALLQLGLILVHLMAAKGAVT
ncbi:MAG: hypothetical protein Q8Q73_14420 [Stagnimonas sp.]|nr:hypothetical protein [Stagnimonas sp.]